MSEHGFEIDGQQYMAAPDLDDEKDGCAGCALNTEDKKLCGKAPPCSKPDRADGKFVIFVKEPTG